MNDEIEKIRSCLDELGFQKKPFAELSASNSGRCLVSDINEAYWFDGGMTLFYEEGKKLASVDALFLADKLYLIEFKPIDHYRTHPNRAIEAMRTCASGIDCHVDALKEIVTDHDGALKGIAAIIGRRKDTMSKLADAIGYYRKDCDNVARNGYKKLKGKIKTYVADFDELHLENVKANLGKKVVESIYTLREFVFKKCKAVESAFEVVLVIVTEDLVDARSAAAMQNNGNSAVPLNGNLSGTMDKYKQKNRSEPFQRMFCDDVVIWPTSMFSDNLSTIVS